VELLISWGNFNWVGPTNWPRKGSFGKKIFGGKAHLIGGKTFLTFFGNFNWKGWAVGLKPWVEKGFHLQFYYFLFLIWDWVFNWAPI